MKTLQDILQSNVSFLEKHKIKNSKFSVESIIAYVLNIKRSDIFFSFKRDISKKDEDAISYLIKRRSRKEPLEYILGFVDFYDVRIEVNQDVLIPRVETEILVDLVAKDIENNGSESKVLFDICTGSGCIGIALKKRFPDLKIYLSDISQKAVDIAQKNACLNNVNIFLKKGDFLNPFLNIKADYIICNPPYISEKEYLSLDLDVLNFEPKIALTAPNEGLHFYIRAQKELNKYLNACGKVFFEIGYLQKNSILKIFSDNIWKNKKVIKDFSNKDRFFFVEIE